MAIRTDGASDLGSGGMGRRARWRDRPDTRGRLSVLMAGAILLQTTPAGADGLRGSWSPLAPWPLVAIHATLLPDGRVLTYGTNRDGQQTGRFLYDLWDPRDGLNGGHLTLPNTTPTDLFCNGQLVLPESGDVFLAGGDNWTGSRTTNTGTNDTALFRTGSNSLMAGPDLHRPRWYATLTTLPDGQIYIQGGKGGADRPELRARDGTFRLLAEADTSALHWWYPRNWVAPDGRVFGYSDRAMYFIDPRGEGMISGMGLMPPGPNGITSSEVMYAPGRILRVGGGGNARAASTQADATAAAATIDITGPVPVVTPLAPMPAALHWHTATVLADGRVAVTGGAFKSNQLVGVNPAALLWDPATGAWSEGAATSSGRARLYHATALLLPDASVLVAGGGAPGAQTNLDAEIFRPPYLHEASGALATRPAIAAAPDDLAIGRDFDLIVETGAAVRRVTLVKTGSVTHSFNMDQRFLELAFTRTGDSLRVAAPTSPADAPPGTYLLFVLDERGVPSPGRTVMMGIAPDPVVAVDWTPSIGEGMDGRAFSRTCPDGKVLVGIYGGVGEGLVSVGPRCAAVDAAGRWVGGAANAPRVGPVGGVPYTRTCPRHWAVSSLSASSAGGIAQLDLGCRALDASGRLGGPEQRPGVVGSAAGPLRGPFACGTGHPAHGLYGRVSTSIRSLGLMCRRPPAIAS